jgi:hypothetical protein
MPVPKLILTNPHIDIVGSTLERCVDYRLTEAVEGITTGDIGYTFSIDEVLTWECSL